MAMADLMIPPIDASACVRNVELTDAALEAIDVRLTATCVGTATCGREGGRIGARRLGRPRALYTYERPNLRATPTAASGIRRIGMGLGERVGRCGREKRGRRIDGCVCVRLEEMFPSHVALSRSFMAGPTCPCPSV
jgi:hypothetical protein